MFVDPLFVAGDDRAEVSIATYQAAEFHRRIFLKKLKISLSQNLQIKETYVEWNLALMLNERKDFFYSIKISLKFLRTVLSDFKIAN